MQFGSPVDDVVSVSRTGARSVKVCQPLSVAGVMVPKKVEPVFTASSTTEACIPSLLCSTAGCLYWLTCRALFNISSCIPDWSGWVSQTTSYCQHVQPSNIGYMAPIQSPITDVSVVYQCLQTSMKVSSTLGQKFTFVTFDLAAAKLAMNVVWNEPKKFESVVIHLGAFHTLCSYMGALGKYVESSGFEEVILEAGVCASGSLQQVMDGRHYNRSLRIHHNMLDAMYRLVMRRFVDDNEVDVQTLSKLQQLSENPCAESLQNAKADDVSESFVRRLSDFVEGIRRGKLGKTAQFWINYCDAVVIMVTFLRAVKENDVDLYISCLRAMCPALFASNRLHYARYLPLYHAQLAAVDADAMELLRQNGLSVSRSHVPACRIPVDQTIEQTINRSAKSAGGVVGFSRNKNAYYRWCVTRHKRASFLDAMYEHLAINHTSGTTHGSLRQAELRSSEKEVRQLLVAFANFNNPFAMPVTANDKLICLSSGRPANEDIETDLLRYFHKGEESVKQFLKDRLVDRTVKFHDRLPKSNLKTFACTAVQKKLTSSQQKTVKVTAERNLLGRLVFLSQTNDISLKKVFNFSLSPVPWSLATGDGCLAKTNKAVLMHLLEKDATASSTDDIAGDVVSIVDGNALIRCFTCVPATFGELAHQLFLSLPKSRTVHFVTDWYVSNSIKDAERLRRGQSKVHLLGGPATKVPRDFSSFLLESENKQQLIRFICSQWKSSEYARLIHGRSVFVVCAESCICLTSADGKTVIATSVDELQSTQEEADTRMILHCFFASRQADFNSTITVRSPDTDVFLLLVHYCNRIGTRLLFDTGLGNNRRLIDVCKVLSNLGHDVASALPAFHAFTGCDTVSAFVSKGKKRPFKLLQNSQQHTETFQLLGQSADSLPDEVMQGLEDFVCCMYGYPKSPDTGTVRFQIFQSRYGAMAGQPFPTNNRAGIDLSLLPPSKDCLQQHSLRANYQTFIWTHAHVPNHNLPFLLAVDGS